PPFCPQLHCRLPIVVDSLGQFSSAAVPDQPGIERNQSAGPWTDSIGQTEYRALDETSR
ncbi:hypothetical protein BaRGS_00014725, partial [Batillaria attramentaria]